MNWLNGFELMCYLIVALMLVDLIRKRDIDNLFLFGSAALVGFFMELAAVAVTDIYLYNQGFWLNLGFAPKQFPVFGGFMWGGLTVYGLRLAEKLKFSRVLTALSAGFFIVTMDILLDVAAIRLDGGFWTWVGMPIENTVTPSAFLSVIWVNFLGYMIETPTVVLLTLKKRDKVNKNDLKMQTLGMFAISGLAILITAAGSLVALGLNSLTADYFSCIVFSALWLFMAAKMLLQVFKVKLSPLKIKKWDFPMLIFWAAMYIYCLLAVWYLGLAESIPWFFIMGIIFTLFTLYTAVSEGKRDDVALRANDVP